MKRNNGFTLIELLAVIVILAIIAIIAVPVILGIINDTKLKKYKVEEGYIKDAAKLYYASKNIGDYTSVDLKTLVDNKFIDPVKDLGNGKYCEGKAIETSDGSLKGCLKCSNYTTKGCGYDDSDEELIVDNNLPNLDNKCVVKNGKYYDNNGKETDVESYNQVCKIEPCGKKDGKYYNDIEEEVTKEDYILSCKINADPEPCSKRLGKYYDETAKEVNEVEYNNSCSTTSDPTPSPDNNIIDPNPGVICGNSTNDYEGFLECHIKSVEDLVAFTKLVNIDGYDFSNHTVYLDKDLNITETSGKSYVNQTKDAEFDINGDGTTQSIKTEMTTGKGFLPIGTEEHPFNGKFDGQANTIKNLMINRTDMDNVGLFGYIGESGQVSGLNIDNISVIGNDNTGGIVGQSLGKLNEVVVSGNVEGHDNVSASTGKVNKASNTNILSNTNVTGNSNVYGLIGTGVIESGTIEGVENVNSYSSGSGFVNQNVIIKINGVSKTCKEKSCAGYIYDDSPYGNLNIYDTYSSPILDTYLGGDNDNSGYYFDYDSKGKVVLKSISRNPIDTTLKGSGTKENPYLIYTANDMKKVAAISPENNYYLLMNDVDFSNKKYYMIGTKIYPFNGTFEGNVKTIKNANVEGYSSTGLFNGGTIYGLKVTNINVVGNENYGAAIINGNSNSKVKEVVVENSSLKGGYSISPLVYNDNSNNNSGIVRNINIEATGSVYTNGALVIESGTIKAPSMNVYNSGFISDKVNLIVDNPDSYAVYYNDDMYDLNSFTTSMISTYSARLDTWLDGDYDNDGYYFDYDSEGRITIRNTKQYPLDTTLKTLKKETNNDGGTKENPYLIYDEKDMKKVSLLANESNYYLLMNDIDYKNKRFYPIGTYNKQFKGIFDGGAHTLKNIKIGGLRDVGMFSSSYNSKVYGLNIENLDVTGQYYTGSIFGSNNGGGLVQDISISGNVKSCVLGNNNCTSVKALGYINENDSNSILTNLNLSTLRSDDLYVMPGKGIAEAGTYKSNGTIYGNYYQKSKISELVKLEGKDISNSDENFIPASKYNNLEYYGNLIFEMGTDKSYYIETKYSGDVNNNGYWFDYNSDKSDIVVVKADPSQVEKPETSKPNPDLVYTNIVNPNASVPDCKLDSYTNVSTGFNAKYTCTDDSKIVERKHIYWGKADVDDYDLLIRWQPITSVSNKLETYSTWTKESAIRQGIDQPVSGNCYYFYYGAKNVSGNSAMYRSKVCKSF